MAELDDLWAKAILRVWVRPTKTPSLNAHLYQDCPVLVGRVGDPLEKTGTGRQASKHSNRRYPREDVILGGPRPRRAYLCVFCLKREQKALDEIPEVSGVSLFP